MIKKPVFENELIMGMQRELQARDQQQDSANLIKAAEYLHSALEIFEDFGLQAQADEVLHILEKIANKGQPDRHTKGLTPKKQISNLLHHGTQFNLSDDNGADDLLNLDINDKDLEINEDLENQMDFEDEI